MWKGGKDTMDFPKKQRYNIDDLLAIMRILRSDQGCPWDREQTHQSIRKNMIEETYEVVEAIDTQDSVLLQEELGDVLMQVVFHAQIEEEEHRFNFEDVCDGVCKKLIVRHPHVFSDVQVSDSAQVLTNWESIKRSQKGQTSYTESLRSVPSVLPSLMRSEKVQSRAAKSGFDYPDLGWAMGDLKSEVGELEEAIAYNNHEDIEEELGDLLFSCVNVARKANVEPEYALTKSCEKFIERYAKVEQMSRERGIDMKTAGIDQLNELWKEAKGK